MTLPGISLPNDRYRRTAGFALGALVGFTYAAVYQFGDQLALPDVPLYRPPFGLTGNLALYALGAGLLGLIAAWPRGGLAGTFAAAAVSAILLVGASLVSTTPGTQQNVAASIIVGVFVALPFWGLLVPLLGALRWVVSYLEEARRDREPWHRRAWRPAALLLMVGLVALTALYGDDARVLLARTHQMLQAAQAGGPLPEPLAAAFAARGQGPYQLAWEGQRIERYQIPRPGRNFNQHSVVVVRFDNGWNLVCLYVDLTELPRCKDMEVIPR